MRVTKLLASMAVAILAAPAGLMALPQEAAAYQMPWEIYNTNVDGGRFSATLDASIKSMGTNQYAILKISNASNPNGGAGSSSINQIWGEKYAGLFDALEIIDNPAAVNFNMALNPHTPPGYPDVPDHPWTGTDFTVKAKIAGPLYGINPGEMLSLALLFSKKATLTDAQLARMIIDPAGDIRLAGQVHSCNGDQSCTITAAPIPGTVWLFASALLGLLGVGYRRRESVVP